MDIEKADMNQYNIEGRYPETLTPQPSIAEAEELLKRSREVMTWLRKQ